MTRPIPGDPVRDLLAVTAELEPPPAEDTVLAVLGQAAAVPAGQRRIARAVAADPALLTGQGARAPFPGVLIFIAGLARAGATAVTEPSCPGCGRRPPGFPSRGQRTCSGCQGRARVPRTCIRCGKPGRVARLDDGQPVCQNCWYRDPRTWKTCVKCGNDRRVAAVTEEGPVCQSCRPGPSVPCGACGESGRQIVISQATGTPVCSRCRNRWAACSRCGTSAPLKGGTLSEPLCARCVNPDPSFWKRCRSCGRTWQMSEADCTRCCLDMKLRQVLASPGGTVPPELGRLRELLAGVDRPDTMLAWVSEAGVRPLLRSVAALPSVTHEALDTLPPGRILTHVRMLLVTAGALPARDERLAALERKIDQAIDGLADPAHRRILRGYAVWHHMRRLRGRLDGQPAGIMEAKNVHDHVTAAAALLGWLEEHGLTMAACSQADLDQWQAGTPLHLARAAGFIRWAVAGRHAAGLTAPDPRQEAPPGAFDQDRRWSDVRRLLHDDAYPPDLRVAGLLVLLYAQTLSDITALTVRHVQCEDGRVLLHLGSSPVTLPPPLDALVAGLAASPETAGRGQVTAPGDWLFPGRWPGTSLTSDALARRLRGIGISARKARSTALLALASEVPAGILAKTLGISIHAAVGWQKASSGDWTSYAADLSRRHSDSSDN